jgi:ribosomal 50S subunit-recycling heat shock protein
MRVKELVAVVSATIVGGTMKRSKLFRNLTSFSLILATFTFFSLTAFATPNVHDAAAEALLADDGTLTASGSVSINGNAVKTGATVTSGSTVSVGDGIAVVDIPGIGRVTVGPSTNATITYSSSGIMVKTTCSDMRVTCNRGSATVTSGSTNKTLTAGQNEYFTSPVDVSAVVGSDIAVNCGTAVICGVGAAVPAAGGFPSYLGVGLLGLLLLGGTATAVTVGVISGGGSRPRVSPSLP